MAFTPIPKSPLTGGAPLPAGSLPTPQINPTFSNRPNVDVKSPFSINPIADNSAGAEALITKAFPAAPLIAQGIKTGDWKPYFDQAGQRSTEISSGLKPGATLEQKQKSMDYLMGAINPEGKAAEIAPEIKAAIQHIPAELMAQADTVAKKILDSGIHAPQAIWDMIRSTFDDVGVKLPKQQSEASDVIQSLVPHYTPPEIPQNTLSHIPHPDFHPPGNSGQMAPQTIETAVKDFTKALQEAKPIRAGQEALYTQERSKRLGQLSSNLETAQGREQILKAKGALAGELPKKELPPINIAPEHVDALFNAINQSKYLGKYEVIQAVDGLEKALKGTVPTTKELELLSQVFPPETIKAITDHRSFFAKIGQNVSDVLNIPRSILSSGDLSAPFRQGLFLIGKPVRFTQAFGSMFKQFVSEKAHQVAIEGIKNRPTYPVMRDAGLAITDTGGMIAHREERFMSNLAEKIPIIGRIVRASGRAYTGFLNKLRADVFDDMLLKAQNTVGVTPERTKQMASFINAASGRGDLASFGRSSEILNGIFFSPRLMASRVQLLRQVIDPVFIARQDPFVRKEAWKTLLSSASILGTMGSLAVLGGAKMSTDPTNADYLKVRVGNTRYDLGGGLTQYVRLMAQIAFGKVTSSTTGKVTKLGEGYKPFTDVDLITRFLQNKENPLFSLMMETPSLLRGNAKNAIGQPTDIPTEVRDRVIPLIGQDIRDAMAEVGPVGIFSAGVPSAFGVGVQTYAAPGSGGFKPIGGKAKASKGGYKPI